MNKRGQRNGMTIVGSIIFIVAGLGFINASGSDATGVVFPIGLIFLLGGFIGLGSIIVNSMR